MLRSSRVRPIELLRRLRAAQTLTCSPSFLSRFCVADSAEIDRQGGHSHGAEPRAVPEGPQRSGIRRAVWHGGEVPGCGDGLALAERLRVPGLRRTSL